MDCPLSSSLCIYHLLLLPVSRHGCHLLGKRPSDRGSTENVAWMRVDDTTHGGGQLPVGTGRNFGNLRIRRDMVAAAAQMASGYIGKCTLLGRAHSRPTQQR
jgi:hypothetical protein